MEFVLLDGSLDLSSRPSYSGISFDFTWSTYGITSFFGTINMGFLNCPLVEMLAVGQKIAGTKLCPLIGEI
jgi:hypothetical protein